MTPYETRQKRKAHYIPLCAAGKISVRKCASILGMHFVSVQQLKNRYRLKGKDAFINGHKGASFYKKKRKYSSEFWNKIEMIYNTDWKDAPFSTFVENLEDYYDIKIPYNTLRTEFRRRGIKPPRSWSEKEKQEHKPRSERPCEGELVQMDASKHDWFMNGTYVTAHGGIDDATHTVTGLYFCLNECRLGYNEVLRQTWTNYGIPLAYYIDRHSSFVSSKRKKDKTFTERIELSKKEHTHFVDLCKELEIEVILALSAQAKGRIERLWQTLQGKLPFIFRFLKIDTCDKANDFVSEWLKNFNAKFKKIARESEKKWKAVSENFDLDYKLSIKFSCRTDSQGYFTFHDCDFQLLAPFVACKKFELCLSEQFGIKAYMNNTWYDVKLCVPYFQSTYGDSMPIVERELIGKYLLNDLRAGYA